MKEGNGRNEREEIVGENSERWKGKSWRGKKGKVEEKWRKLERNEIYKKRKCIYILWEKRVEQTRIMSK